MKGRIVGAIIAVTVLAVGGELGYGPAVHRDAYAAGSPLNAVVVGSGISTPALLRRLPSPLSPDGSPAPVPSAPQGTTWPALVLASPDGQVVELSLSGRGLMTLSAKVVLAHVTHADSVTVEFFDFRGTSLGRVSRLRSEGASDAAFAGAVADPTHAIARIRITSRGRALIVGERPTGAVSGVDAVVIRELVCDGTMQIGG